MDSVIETDSFYALNLFCLLVCVFFFLLCEMNHISYDYISFLNLFRKVNFVTNLKFFSSWVLCFCACSDF